MVCRWSPETIICCRRNSLYSRRILLFPFGNSNAPPNDTVSVYLDYAEPKKAPEGWHACAQFALVISNIHDPTVFTVSRTYLTQTHSSPHIDLGLRCSPSFHCGRVWLGFHSFQRATQAVQCTRRPSSGHHRRWISRYYCLRSSLGWSNWCPVAQLCEVITTSTVYLLLYVAHVLVVMTRRKKLAVLDWRTKARRVTWTLYFSRYTAHDISEEWVLSVAPAFIIDFTHVGRLSNSDGRRPSHRECCSCSPARVLSSSNFRSACR